MVIKLLKIRIKSIKSIQKITKSMKMVSASKLKLLLDSLIVKNKFYLILFFFFKDFFNIVNEGSSIDVDGNKIDFIITSDKGLCGSHNSSVCKKYLIKEKKGFSKNNNSMVIIGTKGNELLYSVLKEFISIRFFNILKKYFNFLEVISLVNKINVLIYKNKIRFFDLCFNKFISTIRFCVFNYRLKINIEKNLSLVYFFLGGLCYFTINSNKVSEESNRLNSMDNAINSANDLLDNLTNLYNRSRQLVITSEIIEIVSGSESIKKK